MTDDPEDRGFVVRDRRVSAGGGSDEAAAAEPEAPAAEELPEPPASEEAREPAPEAAYDDVVHPGAHDPLPPISFGAFVLSLATQAMVHMGVVPNPLTNEKEWDLPAARQTIDILEILDEKTKGNLAAEEGTLMHELLFDLRLKYVDATKRR